MIESAIVLGVGSFLGTSLALLLVGVLYRSSAPTPSALTHELDHEATERLGVLTYRAARCSRCGK